MSSVTSTANLPDFKVRKTNVGVDVSVFQAAEVVCDTIVANNLDVVDTAGVITLEGASVSISSGTGGIYLENLRVPVNLTTAAEATVLTKADSGQIQVINALNASYTFSSTTGLAPVAGCRYRFVSNLEAPGTVTINCATNIAATYQGAVLAIDTDTANTLVVGTSTANTLITLTTANGKSGSWVELVFTSGTTINVTGTIFGVTPANVFSTP